MSKLSLNTAQGKAVALSGAETNAEPLTATTTTTKRTTKKAAALTED